MARPEGRVPVEVVPYAVDIALDVALGLGGLPRGRVVGVCAPEQQEVRHSGRLCGPTMGWNAQQSIHSMRRRVDRPSTRITDIRRLDVGMINDTTSLAVTTSPQREPVVWLGFARAVHSVSRMITRCI